LKAVHHILVSSAETKRAIDSDFDTINLHHPTVTWASAATMLPTTVLAPQWNVNTPRNRAEWIIKLATS
jgi:hypothetical protein